MVHLFGVASSASLQDEQADRVGDRADDAELAVHARVAGTADGDHGAQDRGDAHHDRGNSCSVPIQPALTLVAATAQQCSEVAGSTGPDVGSGGEHGVGDDGGDRPPMTPADPRRYRHADAAEQENYRASRAEAVTPSRGGHRISISSVQATKICSTVEPK